MKIPLTASLIFSLLMGGMLWSFGVTETSALDIEVSVESGSGGSDSDASEGDITEAECASLDESLAGIAGCDTSDQVKDFTELEGGLNAPDEGNYDSTLTQTDNARDFIQQIVNYALGFLGLITVVIIIYGGGMYVLSRGDEEMATKGKKTIGYSAIGILIIMGSFAIVNTIFRAGGGEDGSSGDGTAGGEGTTITETGAAFDVEAVTAAIEDITKDYLNAYESYLAVYEEVAYMKSKEIPIVALVNETDATASGLIEYVVEFVSGTDDDYSDQFAYIDEDAVDDYVDTLRTEVQKIQSATQTYSDAYEAANNLYNYLRSATTESVDGDRLVQTGEDNKDLGCSVMDYKSTQTFFEVSFGVTISKTDFREIDENICSYIVAIEEAAANDYAEQVDDMIAGMEDLRALFDTDDFDSGSQLTSIVQAFDGGDSVDVGAIEALETAKETVGANTVRDIVTAMSSVLTLVENVEFVRVQLSASATEGNDPLIVRLNALGTEDPSGETVQDDQIDWDLDGDGDFDETCEGCSMNENGVEAEDIFGDAVSATFKEPGTYRVRLRVRSTSSDIAAGISTVTIQVEPSKSKIVLSTTAGGEMTVLADFREFPEIDQESYKVTMDEALDGVFFDASETTDGDDNNGAAGGITKYEWDFGDNETLSGKYGEDGGNSVTHAYGEQGTYNVSLTVTDDTGVEDRKLFTLYVASPAARISVDSASGPVGATFEFDGTGSSSDIGQIVSYQWSATKDGSPVILETTTGSAMNATFDEPGLYTVTLQVADNSKTDSASVTVLVESTPPVATYEYTIPSSTQPATYLFDASGSYDPDTGDTITFEWDFDGVEDEDYSLIEASEDLSEMTVQFLKIGSYDVALTAYDQHEGELKKSDTAMITITVESILDIELTIEGENARHLDESGQVEVEFMALSEVATGFQINYGDGNTDFTDSISNGQSIFTHTFESAGVFNIVLTALDDDDHTNATNGRLYIGAGDAPIAVIAVGSEGEDIGTASPYTGSIKTKFSFDASDSVNVDGTNENLQYSWNFGDNVTSSNKTVSHLFEETANYTVILTVRDDDDNAITNTTTVQINVEGIDPVIHGLTITPQADANETPLKVNVSVDAEDEDGEINYIRGWYYDLNDTATELGLVQTESGSFTLTVNTKGATGEVVTYGFAVEVFDNENNSVLSFDELEENEIPTLEVSNGPNEVPVASFSVDKVQVYVGEEVTFSSTSYDPDGKIISYWWDMEGDGFYNNDPREESSFVYAFTQVHRDGVEVQLKVEDSAGATATSDTLLIYVDAISAAPDAAFLADVTGTTVSFRDNSSIDTDNGASLAGIYWDFDLLTDSNGNGVTDDDLDSFEQNPVHVYSALGVYQAKMTIVDSTGQTDTVSQDINVAETSGPVAAFSYEVDDLTVNFSNDSEVDTANNVAVRSYSWDLDLDADSDGDTDPENDVDATTKNPTYEYEDYGEYDVKLILTDSMGKADSIVDTIDVPNPIEPVVALLTSTPKPNSLGQVILEDNGDYVSFFYGAEGGSGDFEYELDKNIFYDTDGDGVRDNDVDQDDNDSGTWKTPFFESYGQVVVKLTVTDTETGESDIATLQVVFEGSLGGANLFNATPTEMLFLILSALLTAILGISVTFHSRKVSYRK